MICDGVVLFCSVLCEMQYCIVIHNVLESVCICMCRDRQGEHVPPLCIMVMMGERSVWMCMVMSVCVCGVMMCDVSSHRHPIIKHCGRAVKAID